MIDLFLNILILIFTVIIVFTAYYTLIVFMSGKKRRLDLTQKFTQKPYNNNLIVIIYAQNNEKTVVPLLEQLNKQSYPKSNYQTHIILDNCTDNSANMLEFIGGAKVWRLSEDVPLGKDEAVSWLLERLISFQNVSAFVFLNANRIIDTEFLSSINSALYTNDIITGSTEIITNDLSFKSELTKTINNYKNRILKTGRSVLGLISTIDSDIVAIKQEVLEKIRCVDFKDTNGELKYTLLLARNNFYSIYNPNVKTWVHYDDFENKTQDTAFKFSLLKNCFRLIFSTNPKFGEFIFSMFIPNILLLTVLYIGIAIFSYNYYFFYDFPLVMSVGLILIGAFAYSVSLLKSEKNILKFLLISPFYTIYEKFIKKNSLINRIMKKDFSENEINTEKAIIGVEVTDGKNILPCKLEMISEDGLVKVVFKFKKKKYTTDSYIRMYDAIKNISDKLEEHGFRIKICQTCAYFTSEIDGTTNMIKGFCNKNNLEENIELPEKKLLWNSCNFYLPNDINKVFDINQYRKNSP